MLLEIDKEEYEKLQRAAAFLDCLEAAGVDNWDGYDFACEDYRERFPQYEGKRP